MSEYFYTCKYVLSELIRNALPQELIAGKHYLLFQNPEECVASCHRVLTDDDLAMNMKKNNREYYWDYVEPSAHLLKIFDSLFE